MTATALNPNADGAADAFPQQVLELAQWVRCEPLPDAHPFGNIVAHPRGPTAPELWILGSSNYGAQLAAHFGLPYAYAYFFSDGRGVEEALQLYRHFYRPSPRHPQPLATVCIWALAADTEAEARHLLHTREYWRVGFERGVRNPLVAPEEAATQPYLPDDLVRIDALRRKAVVGTGAQVAQLLREEAARLELDEVVVVTWTFDPVARRRSYELIAREFGLG